MGTRDPAAEHLGQEDATQVSLPRAGAAWRCHRALVITERRTGWKGAKRMLR